MNRYRCAAISALVGCLGWANPPCGCADAPAADQAATAAPELAAASSHVATARLRVVTYNAHLLPRIAYRFAGHRSRASYRAPAIARKLADYDIVGLCEVFDNQRRAEVISIVRSQSKGAMTALWTPRPRGRRHRTNSGLLLFSRLPVVEWHAMTYRHHSRFLQHGFKADGFAAKGALHARLRVSEHPACEIDCFLTHLESRSDSVRRRQIAELKRFIERHSSPHRRMALMGDMNVPADHPEQLALGPGVSAYQRFCDGVCPRQTRLVDVWPQLGKGRGGTSNATAAGGGARIDYVFISPGHQQAATQLKPLEAQVLEFRDERVPEGSLSDHSAVECVIEVQRFRQQVAGQHRPAHDGKPELEVVGSNRRNQVNERSEDHPTVWPVGQPAHARQPGRGATAGRGGMGH